MPRGFNFACLIVEKARQSRGLACRPIGAYTESQCKSCWQKLLIWRLSRPKHAGSPSIAQQYAIWNLPMGEKSFAAL